jgi:nitrogen fixation negative regulator NifL
LNGGWRGELWNRRKDGSEFPVFLSTSVVHDDQGKPFAFIRSVMDITERKRAEERIFQLNRLYAVLSHINEAIVRIYDIEKLYQEACRITVKDGGFRLAWIGVVDHDTGSVKPVANFGFEDGYLQHIPSSIKIVSEDPGPTEYAIRNKKHFILNDIGAVPAVSGWRAGAIQRGYQSIAAFPLQIGTRVETVINLYSEKKDFFSIEEVKLLDELASDISFALESRKAEDQLRKLSYAVEQSPISVIITDKGGNIEYINPKFTEVTGYTFAEVIGKNPKILKSGNIPEIEYQRLWKTILSGKEWHGEFHNKKKNGELFWESASISPISDPDGKITHFLAVKEDITERKRAEKTIRESEDRYRSLVESSPEAILVEQNGNIVFVNPSGLNLLGYPSVNELSRRSLADIFDKKPGNRPYSIFKSNDPKQFPTSVDGKFVRKDGILIDVSLTVIHTTFQGKPALQLLARDITETKNLRQAAQRMEQLAALGQLSASIAHEIRNPLAAISLNIQLLSNQISIPEEFKDTVNDMTIGVQRIQDIIKGILSFARPAKLTAKNEDIHKVLESSIRAVENDFQKAGITIVKNFGDISSFILIDANQIIEVFVNLFLNAKDALPRGGKLTIRTNVVQDFLEVQVEDTGKGIAPENLEKVFNPFFTTKTKGMGLGLAIVYRILEQHQAKIFVESEVGAGTSFRVQFPLT